MNSGISIDKILNKLDEHLNKNDYDSAERHLLYWLSEARSIGNHHVEITVLNELMGLYRKLGNESEALNAANTALERIESLGIGHQVGAATTYLNSATVCKAFGMTERSISLFERAKVIYENELEPTDRRLGGLYNNMALTLVDLGRFNEAKAFYQRAISVMEQVENGDLEVAITHLNIASALEAELGLEESESEVTKQLEKAQKLLDQYQPRDGYYAFVCEKCASVYGYYGYFLYEKELEERAKKAYEGT